jgi:hypothetical protein
VTLARYNQQNRSVSLRRRGTAVAKLSPVAAEAVFADPLAEDFWHDE